VRDEAIRTAVTNWGPRFTGQGIDPADVTRITESVDRWDDWLDAWCGHGDLHASLARDAEDRGHYQTAGEAWVRAALCYHFGKFVWMVDMARHRAAADKAVAALASAHQHLDPSAERIVIDFDGAPMAGYLRRPPGVARPPLVLLLPGLDSAKEEFFAPENVFLARGMATFSLDGPGQGETGYRTTIRHDYEAPVAAVLDVLCARRDVDGERVGALGVSLGGYYAARTAAFEPRIRAVASCGAPYDFGAILPGMPGHSRVTFMHYSGARSEAEALEAARRLSLNGVLDRVAVPMVVVFGRLDRLVPWGQAVRMAKEAPTAELWMLEEGNHVCMNMVYRWRPQVADWMAERLRAAGA
jgi:dipeptidyl aminopeptidase/acylaminoacyl peptidase